MAFLDKTGLQNLTNKLVQGDAIRVASPKGTTVKEVIDNIQRECENVALPNTMTIENRTNKFKIGQGKNIDVSRDVEEGISVIQLQGKTYQNLLLSSLYFSPHGSDITTINTSEYSIGIKPSGSTQLLKISAKLNCSLIKPNTTYTIILNKIHDSNDFFCVYDATTESFLRNYVHSNIFKFTTKNDLSHIRIYLQNSVINETKFFNKFIILEGDYTQTPMDEIPQYFEGIKSSFEDKVVNINIQNKNLFDYKECSNNYQTTLRTDTNRDYYSYNYKFDIKEPLRRLPNGVCDEITKKGEIIRRINKYTLIGEPGEGWVFHSARNNTVIVKKLNFSDAKPGDRTSCIGDIVPSLYTWDLDTEGFWFDNNGYFYLTVSKSKLTTPDLIGLQKWLSTNPFTIYYELNRPVVTLIDTIKFNVSQGTSVNIISDIPPISIHEVILNRSGQIEQGIELIADLRSRIDKLEKTYDSNLIATQCRLNNLKLNYELEREED